MTASTAPPQWATSLAEWRCGLRWLLRSLVEEEAGRPLPALPKLLHMIPADERQLVLADLRMADYGGADDAGDRLDAAIDRAVWVWETYAAAAYQHGPHVGQLDRRPAAPAVVAHADGLFGAAANRATAAALRADTEVRDARVDELVALVNAETADEIAPHPDAAWPAGDVPHLDDDGSCICVCRRCERPEGGCICPDCNGKCGGHVPTADEIAGGA